MSDVPPRPLLRTRVDALAARVRWLDRYRRAVAILAAAVIAPLLLAQVADVLGADWPEMHATLLSLMVGVIAWWIIEVGLVYVTALWETEHDRLLRDRGLPRAILYRRR
jgi:DMSO/TMAO reductase YedYZ heme-binding membrane subunit